MAHFLFCFDMLCCVSSQPKAISSLAIDSTGTGTATGASVVFTFEDIGLGCYGVFAAAPQETVTLQMEMDGIRAIFGPSVHVSYIPGHFHPAEAESRFSIFGFNTAMIDTTDTVIMKKLREKNAIAFLAGHRLNAMATTGRVGGGRGGGGSASAAAPPPSAQLSASAAALALDSKSHSVFVPRQIQPFHNFVSLEELQTNDSTDEEPAVALIPCFIAVPIRFVRPSN